MQEDYAVLKRSHLHFAIILMALAAPHAALAHTQEPPSVQPDTHPETGQSTTGATTTRTCP